MDRDNQYSGNLAERPRSGDKLRSRLTASFDRPIRIALRFIQVYLVALLAVNRLQETSGLLEEDLNSESPSVSTLGVYGIVGARSGDMERASFALKELDGMEAFNIRIWRSRILAAMGNNQDAIRQLGSIEVDPWGVEMPVGVWPEFETLRDDPAFPALTKLE